MRLLRLALCLSSLFVQQAAAWTEVGHKLVGEIAWRQLSEGQQQKLAAMLSRNTPPLTSDILQQAAVAMDKDKSITHAFDTWHYIDNPIVVPPFTYNNPLVPPHIVWALKEAEGTIKKTASKGVPAITSPGAISHLMLEAYVHLVGDIHQPLHCAELYSTAHPEGDKGGNAFPIIVNGKSTNLHLYWDMGLGAFGNPHQSIEENRVAADQIRDIATALIQEFPIDQFGDKSRGSDYAAWANESYKLAKEEAYNTPENGAVSAEYIQKGQHIAKERVALAGYRLGNQLKVLLGG